MPGATGETQRTEEKWKGEGQGLEKPGRWCTQAKLPPDRSAGGRNEFICGSLDSVPALKGECVRHVEQGSRAHGGWGGSRREVIMKQFFVELALSTLLLHLPTTVPVPFTKPRSSSERS